MMKARTRIDAKGERALVKVVYQDGSRELYLEPGEQVDETRLNARAVREHIRLGELEPVVEEAQPEPANEKKRR